MAVSNGYVESSSTVTSNGLSSIEKEFICAICHELFVRAHTLSCSHTFCEQCISSWLRKNKICPICRKEVVGTPVHSIVLDNAISKLVEYLPKQPDNEAKAKPETVSPKEHCTTKTTTDNHSRNALNSTPPSSSWSSWRNGDYYYDDEDYDDEEDEGSYDDEEEDEESYDDEEDDYDDALQDDFGDNFHVEHHHHYYSNDHYEDEDGRYYDDDEDYSEEGSDDNDYDSEEEDDSEDETDESVDEYDNGPDYNGLPGYYWGKYGYCFKCGDRYHWANGCPNR